MSKKSSDTFYVIDHANKLADRERLNPNRKKRRLMQTWDKTSGATTIVENELNRPDTCWKGVRSIFA